VAADKRSAKGREPAWFGKTSKRILGFGAEVPNGIKAIQQELLPPSSTPDRRSPIIHIEYGYVMKSRIVDSY
jgi:hypothetical protein